MTLSPSRQNGTEDLRAGTLAFIADDPVTLALVPGRATATEAADGGYDYAAGSARDPQDFKIIGEFGTSAGRQQPESGVDVRQFGYLLLGAYDAAVEVGDYWIDGKNRYVVDGEVISNGYEKRFSVTSIGPEPNYG